MKSSLCIGHGCRLFLLGEAGILFSEQRQELVALNTAAAFIWCCLEEGYALDALVAAFGESFGIGVERAQELVEGMLAEWEERGFVSGAPQRARAEVDWDRALAGLMASEELREQFRSNPGDVARKLGVKPKDRAHWRALRSEEIDACAERLQQESIRSSVDEMFRSAPFLLWSMASGERGKSLLRNVLDRRLQGRRGRTRCYKILTITLRIEYGDAEIEARIHPALQHLETAEADVDREYSVIGIDGGYVLLDGVAPIAFSGSLEQITPRIKTLLAQAASESGEYVLQLHAGVISNGESCVLFPAAPGSGKTTLSAAMMHAGYQYFSDEVALLEGAELKVRPVPISLSVKRGAREILASRFPVLRESWQHLREDCETVTYLSPRPEAMRYDRELSYPVAWVVFPKYEPGVETRLVALDRAEAVARLAKEILVVGKRLDAALVGRLVRWIQAVECFELPNSSLDEAVECVRGLMEAASPLSASK